MNKFKMTLKEIDMAISVFGEDKTKEILRCWEMAKCFSLQFKKRYSELQLDIFVKIILKELRSAEKTKKETVK